MIKSCFKVLIALLTLTQLANLAHAQTPTGLGEQGWYADPEAHVFAGQYWIYPTYSDPAPLPAGTSQFTALQQARRDEKGLRKAYLQQTFMDAFSSPDLVHWTKHPHVLDVKNVPWAAYAVWAPSVIELKGKYYIFFGANDIQKDETTAGGIGVAVSDSPGGPFVDALGKPLIGAFYNGAQPIDPFVYQDDDGRIYLYYSGQGHCNVVGLTADLKAVTPLPDGELYKEITPSAVCRRTVRGQAERGVLLHVVGGGLGRFELRGCVCAEQQSDRTVYSCGQDSGGRMRVSRMGRGITPCCIFRGPMSGTSSTTVIRWGIRSRTSV